MARRRRTLGGSKARIHGGKPGQQTVGLHFDRGDPQAIAEYARFLAAANSGFTALLEGSDVDITFNVGKVVPGKTPIRVTRLDHLIGA
jgi:hypothetical protein